MIINLQVSTLQQLFIYNFGNRYKKLDVKHPITTALHTPLIQYEYLSIFTCV